MSDTTMTPAPKVDPETLVLRGSPVRAIRFKRGVIIAAATIVAVFVLAAAWLALRPHVNAGGVTDDRSDLAAKPALEALARAPASYSDVPQLGPPLPGDLGKPILERQQSALAPINDPAVQSENQQRQQLAAERKAARESGLLVQTSGHGGDQVERRASVGSVTGAAPIAVTSDPDKLALDAANDPNAQGHKADFMAVRDTDPDVNPHGLQPPRSRNMLSAGSVIAASLITGLRSDLPGLIIAQVTENTYDSATGRTLLLPQGARLIGRYDSVVAFGQRRALLVWQRIILPDGSSMRLDNEPATDATGFAGLEDKVDFHTWTLLKGVVLSTLLGVSSDLALSGQGDLVQAIRLSTQDSVSRASDQITQHNLGIQPTITIRPGATVRLVVHRDLVFR